MSIEVQFFTKFSIFFFFGSNFSRVFYKLIFFFFYLIQATKHAFAQDYCNPRLSTGTPSAQAFIFY